MKQEYLDFISELFPFAGLSRREIEATLGSVRYSVEEFSRNELIITPESESKRIGFVISGECTVEKPKSDGVGMPLNTHGKGASFGILSVFNPDAAFPTRVRAAKAAKILFIDGEDMIKLVRSNADIAMNVITFLSRKVSFLNKKVSTFSEKTTLGKVAAYLVSEAKKSDGTVRIARTKMAEAIGIGRASLYRDLDTLENEGIIKQDAKKIIIICSEELERKIK
jgi:CRP-like cAMP-binding protein